jgi:hypothetical protein
MELKRLKSFASRSGVRRLRPSRPAVVAFALSLSTAWGVTTALAYMDEPEVPAEEAGQYPATKRVEVATGSIPGIGRYRLLHSRDYKGGMCVGLELVDLIPPGARGPDISEGCGGPEYLNIGTEATDEWTIIHGKLPDNAKDLRITKPGGATLRVASTEDDKGINGNWVVEKLDGRYNLDDLKFEAVDANSRSLATQSQGEIKLTN